MKQDLVKAIKHWESGAQYETRRVTSKPTNGDEYILFIAEAVDLTFEGETRTVSEYTYLLTYGQSNSSKYPSSGDTYRFEKIAAVVEGRFLSKCSDVLKELMDSKLNDESKFEDINDSEGE